MRILSIQRTLLNDLVFTLITQAPWGPHEHRPWNSRWQLQSTQTLCRYMCLHVLLMAEKQAHSSFMGDKAGEIPFYFSQKNGNIPTDYIYTETNFQTLENSADTSLMPSCCLFS